MKNKNNLNKVDYLWISFVSAQHEVSLSIDVAIRLHSVEHWPLRISSWHTFEDEIKRNKKFHKNKKTKKN